MRRGPFFAFLLLTSHRAWKWRKFLGLFKPKYVVLSLLFIGWTGSGGSTSARHPSSDDDDDDDSDRPVNQPHRSDDILYAATPSSASSVLMSHDGLEQSANTKRHHFFATAFPAAASRHRLDYSLYNRKRRGKSSCSLF
mmetsp:Transcript_13557/g.20226  ORF Transcript_13557/g.20226 Transcript_13557/m.20226 type:complete len:139 (+) Transcript_13557:70-486(+)